MKVLISVFQMFVMVMVVLFSVGILEVVSYYTVNEPLAEDRFQISDWEYTHYESRAKRKRVLVVVEQKDFYHEQHWTIRYTRPYWLTPKG